MSFRCKSLLTTVSLLIMVPGLVGYAAGSTRQISSNDCPVNDPEVCAEVEGIEDGIEDVLSGQTPGAIEFFAAPPMVCVVGLDVLSGSLACMGGDASEPMVSVFLGDSGEAQVAVVDSSGRTASVEITTQGSTETVTPLTAGQISDEVCNELRSCNSLFVRKTSGLPDQVVLTDRQGAQVAAYYPASDDQTGNEDAGH